MTIEFADPGYDPTLLFIGLAIMGLPLLVALIAGIAYFARSTVDSDADVTANWALLVAAVFAVFFVGGMGGAGGANVYHDRVQESLYETLDEAGFTQIEIVESESSGDPERMTGLLNGKPFVGTITNLNYPKDYTYKVSALTE